MSSLYLKSVKKGKENELRSYKRRRDQLTVIYSNITNCFNDNASDINRRCREAGNAILQGIQIQSGGGNRADVLWRSQEDGSYDSMLLQSLECISAEIRSVNLHIENLQREISRLDIQITDELQKERKQKEEKLNKGGR